MSDHVQKQRIMIADDSRTIRAAINKTLRTNYDVLQAEDGEDAWQQLMQTPDIRMVISDIMMPNLDGYGLICRIRAAEQTDIQNLPILVITSSDDAITRERAHACGANDFIVKPVESSDLMERVNFHTEAKLAMGDASRLSMHEFAEVETTVVETPDINAALEIIRGVKEGAISPYAIDLCIEVIPLLEYCDQTFSLGIETEIDIIKEQLDKQVI
jgi:response regulator RpfG family c-di-GMP phosphodiesterase